MQKSKTKKPDFSALWEAYQKLPKGQQAELRRVEKPGDLRDVPAFYRLLRGTNIESLDAGSRLVYCLPWLKHKEGGSPLGKALADAELNERRLFIVTRSREPNDLIQLRRVLQQVKPTVDFFRTAELFMYWHQTEAKQKMLEDFFFHQKESH